MRVEIDYQNIDDIKQALGEKLVNKATNSATKKLVRFAKSDISKITRKTYNIKSAEIKKNTKVRKSRDDKLIIISGRPLPLKYFKPRQTKRGVTFKIRKDRGRQRLRHAFIVNKLGDNVFERVSNKALPIAKKFTISIPQMIGGKDTEIMDDINNKAEELITHEIEFRINKKLENY